MNESKVMRDPVHGYIHIEDDLIWDLLKCREVQRMRRIHQLGGVFQVYHGAEHSRFSHSLGVYEIARRMTEEVAGLKENMTEQERLAVLCAALLHDLGHGPFSHYFENLSQISHEDMGCALITYENSDVNQVLVRYDPNLPAQITDILNHRHENPLLNTMISSQLDADRMDYLLRDAYFTGTRYGNYDIERILRTMRVKDQTLCIKESGKHAVEDYLMARYQMFGQIYLHPDASSYDILISLFFKRYEIIRNKEPIEIFEPLYTGLNCEDFIRMDDYGFYYGFLLASKSQDPILSDLANRILNRGLLDWKENASEDEIQKIQEKIQKAGFDLNYYFANQEAVKEYLPYAEDTISPVMVDSKETLQPLSAVSEVARALLQVEREEVHRIYFPKEIGIE